MSFSVTWLNKKGQSRTETISTESAFLAVQTAQALDQVARVLRVVPLTT